MPDPFVDHVELTLDSRGIRPKEVLLVGEDGTRMLLPATGFSVNYTADGTLPTATLGLHGHRVHIKREAD